VLRGYQKGVLLHCSQHSRASRTAADRCSTRRRSRHRTDAAVTGADRAVSVQAQLQQKNSPRAGSGRVLSKKGK